MKRRYNSGFTLVELLVVITIIGLLATVILVSLTNAKARARDSRRVSDMDALQKALALYLTMNDGYPPSAAAPPGDSIDGTDALSVALDNANLLSAQVMDPINGQPAGGSDTYEYLYYSAGDDNYVLTYCTETSVARPAGCGHTVTP